MSYTELHVGKFVKIDLTGKTVDSFIDETVALDKIDDYYNDAREYFEDEYSDKYLIVGDNIYEIRSKISRESDGDIMEGFVDKDGNIDYVLQFYNGACGFSEVAEELLEKLKLV